MPTIVLINATSRTCVRMAGMALERGINVRAIVRSAARYGGAVKPHELLSVHEVKAFNDVEAIRPIISGADAIFVTLDPPQTERSSLMLDSVATIVAAIRANSSSPKQQQPGPPLPRLVLLSSNAVHPSVQHGQPAFVRFLRNQVLKNHYDDIDHAQWYLQQQTSWLPWTVFCPGGIVDVEESDAARIADTRLETAGRVEKFISYQRLAAAMLRVLDADGGPADHTFVCPVPTSDVAISFRDMESLRHILFTWFRSSVLLPGQKIGACMALGAALALAIARRS